MVTIGERVGSYRVVRGLGSGGMGMVFEAVHERIRSRAAIKILHSQYSASPEVRERFLTEALATNLVRHPGIVSIFEHGQLEGGDAFIIMEYLDGDSLRARIDATLKALQSPRTGPRSGGPGGTPAEAPPGEAAPLDRPTALRLMRQLASAIAAAHDKRIVHRDLKPENIMIVKDPFTLGGERVKVLDFGIAKVLGDGEIRGRTGGLLGTPAYMAPEAWSGAATVNEKADVYALGIILFETLTGLLPFEDAKNNILKWQKLHESDPPLRLRAVDASIPESLDALVSRLLSKSPHDRPTMAEAAAELDQLVGQNLRFRAGGFVRDGEFYARREADDALFYGLLNGHSSYVLAPRQVGKTSLMHATIQRLTNVRGPELERGVLCAVLDLHTVEPSGSSPERFYFELVRELFRGLGLPGLASDFWAENQAAAPAPSARFARLLRLLPTLLSQPAVVFVDHLEVLLRLALPREEFFAALCAAQTQAPPTDRPKEKRPAPLATPQRVSYCLLGTGLKDELMPDERRSPFARSRPVVLGDLTSTEARALLPGLHTLGAASEQGLAAILGWTGGHPCFTQRLCESLTTRALPDGSIQHLVDSVAGEVIAASRGREDPSLAFAEDGVRRAGALRPLLLALYRQILAAADGIVDPSAAASAQPGAPATRAVQRLEVLGMVRRDGDRLHVRNRIFAAVFSTEWLRGEEAVRPVQAALTTWKARDRNREFLLGGQRLSEALAWARARQDLTADEQEYLSASVEREQRTQGRRVALLLTAVAVLLTSLLAMGMLWRNVRLAKQQVEAHQVRLEAALREAERARKEAEIARSKTMIALKAADEARRAADEARIEAVGAMSEAARQHGIAVSAGQRAKAATDRAVLAAREAQLASQTAQEASHLADEANLNVGRALNEKAEAVAGLQGHIQQCEKDRRTSEAAAQRCQQSLDAKDAEAQSMRADIATLNSQISTLNSQHSTTTAQLAACRSEAKSSEASRGESGRGESGRSPSPATSPNPPAPSPSPPPTLPPPAPAEPAPAPEPHPTKEVVPAPS